MMESYVCKNCGAHGIIKGMTPLLKNVRYDVVECPNCHCAWRVYYEIGESTVEIVSVPTNDIQPDIDIEGDEEFPRDEEYPRDEDCSVDEEYPEDKE